MYPLIINTCDINIKLYFLPFHLKFNCIFVCLSCIRKHKLMLYLYFLIHKVNVWIIIISLKLQSWIHKTNIIARRYFCKVFLKCKNLRTIFNLYPYIIIVIFLWMLVNVTHTIRHDCNNMVNGLTKQQFYSPTHNFHIWPIGHIDKKSSISSESSWMWYIHT